MWTRIIAIAAIIPFLLLAALVSALPRTPSATSTPTSPVQLSMPSVRVVFAADAVELSGVVPDRLEHDALMRRAVSIYGRAKVTDRLRVGVVANPAWLDAALLPDLRGLSRATVTLDDAHLQVDGIAPSVAASDLLAARLRLLSRHGIRITNRVVVDPG